MRSGLYCLVLAVCLLAVAFSTYGGEISIYVDGEPVSLGHTLIQQGNTILAPLRELGLYLGIEAAYTEEEQSIAVRSAGGERFFPADHFPSHDGVYYVSLDELIDIASAQIHTVGDEIHIESEASHLTSLTATGGQVAVRFDSFVPYQLISDGANAIHLRFYHCKLDTAPREVAVTGGSVTAVTLGASSRRTADLIITLSDNSLPQIKRFSSSGFYSVSLLFDHQSSLEIEDEIAPHITYHEITTDLGDGPLKLKYLYVDEWRDHYRLVPSVPKTGVGTLASLADIARGQGAQAAINGNFFDTSNNIPIGLLITDGQVLSSNYERRAALGIDIFGRLTFFNPTVSLFLRAGGEKIAIADVNRPIKSGELIVYTRGYSGPLTSGFSDSFRVVKVRDDTVTSIQDGPYVIADPSADILVASGSARSRIASLSVGENVNFEYTLDQGDLLITNAVSAGPLLYSNGNKVLDPAAEGFQVDSYLVRGLAARSVLATDWYGGLILMTVVKNSESVGTDFDGLLTLLSRLPVKIKNAIAFDGGHSSSLLFKDGAAYREISSGGKVAVGLLLVATDR